MRQAPCGKNSVDQLWDQCLWRPQVRGVEINVNSYFWPFPFTGWWPGPPAWSCFIHRCACMAPRAGTGAALSAETCVTAKSRIIANKYGKCSCNPLGPPKMSQEFGALRRRFARTDLYHATAHAPLVQNCSRFHLPYVNRGSRHGQIIRISVRPAWLVEVASSCFVLVALACWSLLPAHKGADENGTPGRGRWSREPSQTLQVHIWHL